MLLNEKIARWLFPDAVEFQKLPDFPNDMNACITYIVPKLLNGFRGRTLEGIHFYPQSDGWVCELDMEQVEDRRSPECEVFCDRGSTEPTAFCLAVDKLIKGEK